MMKGLYLHIPFCEHKCIYCDFYSIEQSDSFDRFVRTITREINLTSGKIEDDPVFTSIFFGGGTPSLLSPVQIRKIMDALHRNFVVAPDAEVTVETNPGTVDDEKLRAYKAIGVNRLSIGVQSFSTGDLTFLTRIHSVEDAERCYYNAREAAYDNINIDLMFSLPTHTKNRWINNLNRIIELEPDHISAYSLTYEKGTPLYQKLKNKEVTPLEEDLDAELYGITLDMLDNAGYEQYEISNYARSGKQCLHNRTYWESCEYLGFGPSAHSFYKGRRYWNINNLQKYNRKVRAGLLPVAGEEMLTELQRAEEEIFLGLRKTGIDLKKMKNSYNLDILKIKTKEISSFSERGFVVIDNDYLRLTKQGKAYADMIASELM